MRKVMTISINDKISELLETLSEITSLKKSTIIRLAVKEWSKQYLKEEE